MHTREAVRVVLVGTGNRGRVWASVCAQTPGVALVGLVDTDAARAEAVAASLADVGPHVWADLDGALRQASADAVIVATPPETHHGVVGAALAAGKHVLCEKPLSERIEEVVDLVARADASRLHLLVGMNFRYLSTSQRIREYVQDGRWGAPSHASFTYVRQRNGNRADLNDYPLTMAYPMLFEQSIHHFDLLRYCYGSEVRTLVADSWRPAWSTYRGDCCVSALLRFENGVHANYLGTWTASWNRMMFRWRTEFPSGVLVQRSQFDDLFRVEFQPELGLYGSRFKTAEESEPMTPETLAPCVPFRDDSRLLLMELVRAIREGLDPSTTGRDHLHSLCLVLACIESAKTRTWVDLPAFQDGLGLRRALRASPRARTDV